MPAEEIDGLAGQRRRLREDGVEVDRLRHHKHGEDAECEAEIADAVDDEGLDRGGVGLGLVVPEADQEIAREAYPFQPKNICARLSAVTSASIAKVKSDR